jgi:hypothetical protein
MFEVLLNVLLRNKKYASNFVVYLYPTYNKQHNEQYLPISTDKLCNTFAKLLTPNPSDYHFEIRKIPIYEMCLVPRVSYKRLCTCTYSYHCAIKCYGNGHLVQVSLLPVKIRSSVFARVKASPTCIPDISNSM